MISPMYFAQNVNLTLIAIAATLTLWAIIGAHVVVCEETDEINGYCTLSLNTWSLTSAGYKAIQANVTGGTLVIDVVNSMTVTHFLLSAFGLAAYLGDFEMIGAGTTALGHICGWVILGVVVSETPIVEDMISEVTPLIFDNTTTGEVAFGDGIVASITATSIQLVAVGGTIAKLLMAM